MIRRSRNRGVEVDGVLPTHVCFTLSIPIHPFSPLNGPLINNGVASLNVF